MTEEKKEKVRTSMGDLRDRLADRLEIEIVAMESESHTPDRRREAGMAAAALTDSLLGLSHELRLRASAVLAGQERERRETAVAACDHKWVIGPRGSVCCVCNVLSSQLEQEPAKIGSKEEETT